MRISQAYVSKSVADFPMHAIFSLDDYRSTEDPCLFIGNYRFEDLQMIRNHKGYKMIFWTGQDALNFTEWDNITDCINVTAHPKVYWTIRKYAKCMLVRPSHFIESINPVRLGPQIYAYCPSSSPEYHGGEIIKQLQERGYTINIGDGSIPQNLWKYSQAAFYDDIYIGLCLSQFAGGGGSIIEMGLRGIPVVTNVFKLPNCLPWQTIEDVVHHIEDKKLTIGNTNRIGAQNVWDNLDHSFEWLTIPDIETAASLILKIQTP